MNKIKEVRKILSQYKRDLFKLNNFDSLKISDDNFDEEYKNMLSKKVSLINEAINTLPFEESDLLIKYFIENKKRDEFYWSDSTLYWKLKKTVNDFLGLFNVD